MSKIIEIRNITRSETQPILIKEKISENGETKPIIYQRKNIESINGVFEKIKTKIRYTAEDFAEKFDLTSLKKILGFESLKTLVHKEESKWTLRTCKQSMNTTGLDDQTKYMLNNFLSTKFMPESYADAVFEVNKKKYETSEFLNDLSEIKKLQPIAEMCKSHPFVFIYFEESATSSFMKREEIKTLSNGFEVMKSAIEKYLTDNNAPRDIKERFIRKLVDVREESIKSKPTDKEMKQWCLKNEEERYNSYGQGYRENTQKTAPKILRFINQFFSSTSSEEQKENAQINLQQFYRNERAKLPLYIEQKLFPEQEGFYESCFFPTKIIDHDNLRMISSTAKYIPR